MCLCGMEEAHSETKSLPGASGDLSQMRGSPLLSLEVPERMPAKKQLKAPFPTGPGLKSLDPEALHPEKLTTASVATAI